MTIQDLKDKGLLLLECISGSKAYGLDTPESDTDIKGVFYMPKELFYGTAYIPQIANETNDMVYYELGRFVELLLKNNPNILELLATAPEMVLYRHPLMERLPIELFCSRLCRETFAGYAFTQIRKARGYKKKAVNPVEAQRKSLTDFCYIVNGPTSVPLAGWLREQHYRQDHCGLAGIPHAKGLYALFYDEHGMHGYEGVMRSEAANDVVRSSIPAGERLKAYLFFNQEAYSAYCKEYREYWEWVRRRNEARYNGNQAHGKAYDAKNMMHTIRLLQVAKELLTDGVLRPVRPNREELLAIKKGSCEYEELLMLAEGLMQEIEVAAASSPLPEQPDEATALRALVQMREALYDSA